MDKWEAMQVFVRVVESGSFVRAAQKLELSTTATSRLVAELESHLGTRLLQRSTRRLNLTEAGQRFFDRAGQLLLDLEEAEAEVGAVTRMPTGLLRHAGLILPILRICIPNRSGANLSAGRSN